MSGDQGLVGDDEFGDQDDYESEVGADDWYNDGHDSGSYGEDDLGGAVIFWLFWIACLAAQLIKPPS